MPISETNFLYSKRDHYDAGRIDVGDGHTLYYEQSGNPVGIPIVCTHGGPGLSISKGIRTLFSPEKFRLIQYDQRGCGQITPQASLDNNTTPHLCSDLNKLRIHLQIKAWHVFGGSWGSTLALAYANTFPEQIISLIINGIFLGSPEELREVYLPGGLVSKVYPEVFEKFYDLLPEKLKSDPVEAYHQLLNLRDNPLHLSALSAWVSLHTKISMLNVADTTIEQSVAEAKELLPCALFELHYFRHNCFIDGAALLRELPTKLRGKEVHIVHSRYDMVCPFKTAWKLHKALDSSKIYIVENAGHNSSEIPVARQLVEILNAL